MVRGRLLYMRRNTKGIEFISCLLFFMIAAFPKNAVKLIMNGELKLLNAYMRGIFWHLGQRRVNHNPQMVTDTTGDKPAADA